jgi:hypothetical protein
MSQRICQAESVAVRRSVHLNMVPAGPWLDGCKHVAATTAPVLIVVPLLPTRLGRQRHAGLGDQLRRALVEADDWPRGS